MDKAAAQGELNECAAAEAQRADLALNETFQRLLVAAKSDGTATKKIKEADRAWITYRDAYLDARFPAKDKQREYGTKYPTEYALFRAKLTYRQIETLKDLLDQYATH
ncbi:MAG: lysozyme inhibitor LprI family protein [Acidobacteriota bacterium]